MNKWEKSSSRYFPGPRWENGSLKESNDYDAIVSVFLSHSLLPLRSPVLFIYNFFFLLTKRRHFVGQLPSSLFFLFFFFSFYLENLFSNCLTLYYFSFSLSPVLLALGAIFDHRCSLVWTLRVGAIRRYYANVICWLGSRYGYAIDFQEFDWQQCNGGERERETRAMSELAELTTPRRGDAAEIIPDPISLQNHRP